MAEETPALEEGKEPQGAPDTGAEEAPQTEQADETPEAIVDLARKAGWTPKDEFKGNPEKWKPAEDYLLFGKDNARSMSREMRGLRDQIDRLSRTSATIMEDRLAAQEAHWKAVHEKAVKDDNFDLAERALGERVKITQAKASQPSNEQPPETAEFVERHKSWFGVDRLATLEAKQVAEALARDGEPVTVQLREAERAVKRKFPELFSQGKPAPGVAATRTRTAGTTSREKKYADMPPESRAMADDYFRRHKLDKEDFAKSYWADAANQERKAG